MKSNENFKNIKPDINFDISLDFEKFMDGVLERIKLKEILTDEELEENKKEMQDDGTKKLF